MTDFKIHAVKKEPKNDFPNFINIDEGDAYNLQDYIGHIIYSNRMYPGQYIYQAYYVHATATAAEGRSLLFRRTGSQTWEDATFSLQSIPRECLILHHTKKKTT